MLCPEKQVFATLRGAAEEAVYQLDTYDRKLRVYPCPICERYHLTSQPMGGQDSITAEMVRRLAASVSPRTR